MGHAGFSEVSKIVSLPTSTATIVMMSATQIKKNMALPGGETEGICWVTGLRLSAWFSLSAYAGIESEASIRRPFFLLEKMTWYESRSFPTDSIMNYA